MQCTLRSMCCATEAHLRHETLDSVFYLKKKMWQWDSFSRQSGLLFTLSGGDEPPMWRDHAAPPFGGPRWRGGPPMWGPQMAGPHGRTGAPGATLRGIT